MKYQLFLGFLISAGILFTGACQNGEPEETAVNESNISMEQEQETDFLYEDESLKITQTKGWTQQESSSKYASDHIMFQNGNLKAIVRFVSMEKSLNEIKGEFKSSLGNSEVFEETENYLSLRSNRKESVRTDIYFNKYEMETGIMIFMAPSEEFESNAGAIEELISNTQYH